MKIYYLKRTLGLLSFFLIFTIIACSHKNKELSQRDSDILQKYLDEKVIQPINDGKVFSAHKLFKKEDDTLYIWAYMQEYYKKDGKIELGIGWSVPMEISIRDTLSEVTIKKIFIPGDGDRYAKDIKKSFPDDIQQQVLDFPGTPEVKDLGNSCKERAEKFYK